MNESIDFDLIRDGDIAVFRLKEKKFDAQIAGLVKGEFTILLHSEDIRKLVLDLSDVEYCDSSGLSSILLAFRILQNNGGSIRLASPTQSVKSLIEISQLIRILPICNSVDEAVNELKNI